MKILPLIMLLLGLFVPSGSAYSRAGDEGERIEDMTARCTAPSEQQLLGQWNCCGSRFVFFYEEGPVPSKKEADEHLAAIGATPRNCVLTFYDGHRCNFALGARAFDLTWSLDESTKEFRAVFGKVFAIRGYLALDQDKLVLVYSRPNLFLMMRFLATGQGRRHITPLGELLDSTDGLSVGIEFFQS